MPRHGHFEPSYPHFVPAEISQQPSYLPVWLYVEQYSRLSGRFDLC